jgi:hypothetical protein
MQSKSAEIVEPAQVRDLMAARGIDFDPLLLPALTANVNSLAKAARRLKAEPPISAEEMAAPFDLTRFLESLV